MNEHHRETWNRIRSHDFDALGDALPFHRRLARENGWTVEHAQAVMEEYRRFCFLAVHAGHPVTPSDAVDQAWHLHLVYTVDYWETFCPAVLGRPLHHGPTRGGAAEDVKFEDWYERTRRSYVRFFGAPPADVWPPAAERFANATAFRRVDTSRKLVLDRRTLWRTAAAAGLVGAVGSVLAAEPADSASGIFTTVLVIAAVVVALILLARRARGGAPADRGSGAGCGGGGGVGGGTTKTKTSDSSDTADGGDGSGSSGCGSGCGGGCGG